jgi:16S rRNA (cytosine967-C5)-methyltransferase
MDLAVRVALRIGLYQVLFLSRVPHHSAINDSVELAARARKTSAKGFVNAILRKVSREGAALDFESEFDRIATTTSHPVWLLERWAGAFGQERAFAIATANNEIPAIAFRHTGAGEFENRDAFRASEYVEGCYLAEQITPDLRQMAESGEIYLQDEGSQLAAHAVTQFPGERFLDVCAAPGGKTVQTARSGRFDSIVAGDLHAQRVAHLADTCRKFAGRSVALVRYDAAGSPLPFAEKFFDTVLVDAPCSGTGTIRHNPELRYFLVQEDITELSAKQLAILENASKLVKTGGTLIYSTCSLEREENELVIERFKMVNPDWAVIDAGLPKELVSDTGYTRTFPDLHNMDGFFIACMRK